MNSSGKYDFRQFQDELAALDRGKPTPPPAPTPEPAPVAPKRGPGRPKKVIIDPLADARKAFDALRISYKLTVADVVAWFPEEEGVAYLQALLAQPAPKRRRRKADDAS